MFVYVGLLILAYGCGGGGSRGPDTPWVPQVADVSESNHNEKTWIKTLELNGSAPILGFSDSLHLGETEFTIDVEENLGPAGSLSLIAEPVGIPGKLKEQGDAVPVLVSLHDGKNELINLVRTGSLEKAVIQAPSAYGSTNAWAKYIGYSKFNYVKSFVHNISVNTIPTCNWTSISNSTCVFNEHFFESGSKLRSGPGVKYKATYVLIANNSSVSFKDSIMGKFKLSVLKKAASNADKQAIDVNVVLVGSKNVKDSRTSKGKANLDLLFSHFAAHLSQTNSNIKLGKIHPIEWGSELGGDAFSQISILEMNQLFTRSKGLLPPESDGKALNIYLISAFNQSGIAGATGKINGPAIHGTSSSGLAFSSLNRLASFNPKCKDSSCPIEDQDPSFIDMGSTISHESAHFLGLFHLSERDGGSTDGLPDTPHCTSTDLQGLLSHSSCKNDINKHPVTRVSCKEACPGYDSKNTFCAVQAECEFNHLMWWTSKYYNPSIQQGDGSLISRTSGILMRLHPLVR
jgi:hypothetical protein